MADPPKYYYKFIHFVIFTVISIYGIINMELIGCMEGRRPRRNAGFSFVYKYQRTPASADLDWGAFVSVQKKSTPKDA